MNEWIFWQILMVLRWLSASGNPLAKTPWPDSFHTLPDFTFAAVKDLASHEWILVFFPINKASLIHRLLVKRNSKLFFFPWSSPFTRVNAAAREDKAKAVSNQLWAEPFGGWSPVDKLFASTTIALFLHQLHIQKACGKGSHSPPVCVSKAN